MLDQLSRMDLADVGSPEALIIALLRQAPTLPIPVPVDDVARALDIEEIRYAATDGFEGSLICTPDKNRAVIIVNSRSSRQRQRHSLGHELGHFLIPTHGFGEATLTCSSTDLRRLNFRRGDSAARKEAEANRFASLLLMPPPYFQKDIDRLRACDISHILRLAARYDVSREATGRRYVEMHNDPCALVISRQGTIQSIYRGPKFPFLSIKRGALLPTASLSVRFSGEIGKLSDWGEVQMSIWQPTDFAQRALPMLEQVLIQRDGFRTTLLTVEMPDEDDADEENTIQASWEVRFPRR